MAEDNPTLFDWAEQRQPESTEGEPAASRCGKVWETCFQCGVRFASYRSDSKQGKRRFCSRPCFYTARRFAVRGAAAALRHAFSAGYRAREDGVVIAPDGSIVSLHSTQGRYLAFNVRGASADITVHRFIAYQLYGEEAMQAECVRHLNDIGHDNRFENIAIGTKLQNLLDIPVERRRASSRKAAAPSRKLSAEQVVEIRSRLRRGETLTEIGRIYSVSARTIGGIRDGEVYAEIVGGEQCSSS